MSWRLWEMLPFEALRIDHISWSFVLSATWDQTLSHLASPRNHSLHFRYFQRRRGLLQVAAFKALKMDEVSRHKEKQWERERERERDTIFCETYENWNGFFKTSHIIYNCFTLSHPLWPKFASGGSVLVAQFSSFTTCLHTSHCHTIVQMLSMGVIRFFRC